MDDDTRTAARQAPEAAPKTTAEQTVEQAELLESLAWLAPFVRLFGPRGREVAHALTSGAAMADRARDLSTLPGRFNAALGGNGWIAFGSMDENVMRRATELAELDRVDEAEHLIADSYDEATLRRLLHSMLAVDAYRPRHQLLTLVAEDHVAGRFHAVATGVLPQIDGLVSDLTGKQLFRHGGAVADSLVAWDTIAGREDGLPRLMKLLSEGRWSTSEGPVLVPYRHGILHGKDLGYANKLAAAKTWGALFALREWALAVQHGRTAPPPIEPEPTLRDLLTQWRSVEDERRRIRGWRAGPARGPYVAEEEIPSGSAEAAMWAWLAAWRARDWDVMAQASQLSRRLRIPDLARTLEASFGFRTLRSFTIDAVTESAPAKTVVVATLQFADAPEARLTANVIFESPAGRSEVAPAPGGSWGVNDISALRHEPLT